MQYQAGYILEGVEKVFRKIKDEEISRKIEGLKRHLGTFDCFSKIDLELPEAVAPLLAVAHNIVTRGIPTIASPIVEDYYSKIDNRLRKENKPFSISYELDEDIKFENLFRALHPIDCRYKDRGDFLDVSQTDSNFESSFLLDIIPKEESTFSFLLQKQRSRNTLGADAKNQGHVDFSLEVPYYETETHKNRYNREVEIIKNRRYIVEVDGAKYHEQFIDDLKDFEIAELKNDVFHIREHKVFNDNEELLKRVLQDSYYQVLKANHLLAENNPFYDLVLGPIGVARIQKVLMLFLLKTKSSTNIKVAFLERDVKCANIAVQDLNLLLKNLYELKGLESPIINHEVFTDRLNELESEAFDLVIDISLLSRSNTVIYEENINGENIVEIRNCHHVENSTINRLISAHSIVYLDLVKPIGNEEYDIVVEMEKTMEYFIQLLFRKREFRVGQLPIIDRALKLKPVIGLLPTGGGKSLTYQLAAFLQPGVTMVIDPIRSLMVDQYESLLNIGVTRASFINSSISGAEKRFNTKKMMNGETQFIFVSPERYVIEHFRKSLETTHFNKVNFAYGIIDEVHCVSEWGHDFRTAYLDLGKNLTEYTKTLCGRSLPIFGLTATASYDVLADIERELDIHEEDGNALVRYENTVRDEVNYQVIKVNSNVSGETFAHTNEVKQIIAEQKQNVIVQLFHKQRFFLDLINSDSFMEKNVEKSFNEFLPESVRQEIENDNSKEDYLSNKLKELKLSELNLLPENIATVVFCPHRHGSLGVFDIKAEVSNALGRKIGFFVGGDDERLDKESFDNLRSFKENELDVMVATKAFGMGIDKENVRNTIHINIPQSIESYVQEAGRAGRDKKMSLSTILFNNEKVNIDNGNNLIMDFCLDEDVLDYFHRNSFKGKIKEQQTIYELRSRVTHPSRRKLEVLQQSLNKNFNVNIALSISRNNTRYIYVRDVNEDINIGTIDLHRICNYPEQSYMHKEDQLKILNSITNYVRELNLPQNEAAALLNKKEGTQSSIGIENQLNEMQLGEERVLNVSFNNKYVSIEKNEYNEFSLNLYHEQYFFKVDEIKIIIDEEIVKKEELKNQLSDAIKYGKSFEEFIISIDSDENIQELFRKQTIERAYYLPRVQSDTSKGVYRLVSLGIVDTYTIDYQNSLYKLTFTKREQGYYFEQLNKLSARYSSKTAADKLVNDLKVETEDLIKEGKKTEMSVCLEALTDYIYEKVAKKRKRAIQDMIGMCEIALQQDSLFEQNLKIKEHIFYYFNAKYSRLDNLALVNNKEVSASLPNESIDTNDDTRRILFYYINLLDEDETASYRNNLKHLRGACMRMLRVRPDEPVFKILKGITLLVLSETSPFLLKEAHEEIVSGLKIWKERDIKENIHEIFEWIIQYVKEKNNDKSIIITLKQMETDFYIHYFSEWTNKFRISFTKNLTPDGRE